MMPFRLRVSKVSYKPSEISISGELIERAYIGPEAVSLCQVDGQWSVSPVTHHEVLLPAGWPVVAGDGATLILHVSPPSPDFRLDDSQPVTGRGTLFNNEKRADTADSLHAAAFWAAELGILYLETDEIPNPVEMCWGLSKDQVNEHYAEQFQRRWSAGIWPYIRLNLDAGRYIEIEYATSVEYQTRFWIGEGTRGPRVVLGYDSGHFSLPAFRMEEVLALANRSVAHPAAPLLLLRGTFLQANEPRPVDRIEQWLADVPGVNRELLPLMASVFLDRLNVRTLHWQMDSTYGWINNWPYSQRNPHGKLSILGPEDFRYIRSFFA